MSTRRYVFGDPEVCTGCMICSMTCSMHFHKVISPEQARNRVVRLENGLDFPLFCRNCEDAPCIEACPVEAIRRNSKGIVIIDKNKCKGHGDCIKACPYDAIKINPDTGKAIKCIQCGQCIKRCPVFAIWMTTDEGLERKDKDGRLKSLYEKHEDALYGGAE
ncbi:4Fe-4S dicluster domain-containing protein [Candidatus Thorarchaeota archaeon]|nr:MAG: 4Fe-4S dicluster domain-containing protein [Candidatus Thorarchaeota archaeon]